MGRPAYTVREASGADAEAVAEFIWTAWREAGPDEPGWAGASEVVIRELTEPEHLRGRVVGPGRRTFLALDGDRVVGFAANRRVDQEEVELVGLIVLKERQGQGIGSALLQRAMGAGQEEGYRRMRVRTESNNEPAIRLYESRGFEAVETSTQDVEGVRVEIVKLLRDL